MKVLTVDTQKGTDTKVAIVIMCDTPNKFEICVAWAYDEEHECWGQGHYFTLWYDEITPINKLNLLSKATIYYGDKYLK